MKNASNRKLINFYCYFLLSIGCWVAHGEGKALFPNKEHLNEVMNKNLAPLRYVDDNNDVTQVCLLICIYMYTIYMYI
jgi:phosphoribosylformylglycinamidine (FGAM) synthase-like amidotransferase family enzyme